LYHASRPRKASHRTADTPDDAARSVLVKLAHSELRAHDFLYLSMTIVSPFVGAYLIRYLLTSLEGIDNLSWFSTTLFVLATGIRPWSHFISRLQERTQDLHDAIHYPSENSAVHQSLELNRKLTNVMDRLDGIESRIGELQEKHESMEGLKEVCDDLSEALGDVERTLGKQDRKAEKSGTAQDSRITSLERKLTQLEEQRKKDREFFEASMGQGPILYASYAKTFASTLYRLPDTITPYVPYIIKQAWFWPTKQVSENGRPNHIKIRRSNTFRHHGEVVSSPAVFAGLSPVFRLETILEHEGEGEHDDEPEGVLVPEGDSDSEGTYVSDEHNLHRDSRSPTSTSPKSEALRLSRSRSRSVTRMTIHDESLFAYFSAKATECGSAVVAWPYRIATSMLVMVIPPLRKVFS